MTLFFSLVQELATHLTQIKWQLVTAESCTGGLIASAITDVPGSSAWFERGFVTYSNLSKHDLLGIPKELIERHGAVSNEVASAMALGALEHSVGDLALAVTGIAGPGGGSIEKPVGTVYLSWAVLDQPAVVLKKQFSGTRNDIRLAVCEEALRGAISMIKKLGYSS